MKESGILFRPEMINAYFAGLKTQTRRLVKGVPKGWKFDGFNTEDAALFYPPDISEKSMKELDKRDPRFKCPYGKAGDLIWSRETIGYPLDGGPVIYRADGGWAEAPDFAKKLLKKGKWTPAIHQPRAHSRASMILSSVSVERLQDISEADALAEGFAPIGIETGQITSASGPVEIGSSIASFAEYIDEINGKGTWDSNPWVWVLKFPRFVAGL